MDLNVAGSSPVTHPSTEGRKPKQVQGLRPHLFSDLAATTVEMGDVDGVWIHAVELPGRQRFYWCVEKARYRRTTEAVEQGLFPDWPDSVRASTVESESERVYEVTFVRIRRELDREARPV